ncbi:prostaglandin E2 receptor EP3 subtype-like [Mytilus edulis]|uniref:prostaglandin E2 receptor EP3 subtype-like n=1 Tax=Mytilus edulis TaxID=6550 RepID=UPI0039EE90DE
MNRNTEFDNNSLLLNEFQNHSYLTRMTTNNSNISAENVFAKATPVSSATMFSIGVVGNIFAIIVIWRSSPSHKWKAFYRYVFLLAITDLLGILLTSPITLYTYVNNRQWIGGQPLCNFYGFQMAFSGVATVLIAGAMSVDRLMAVYFPYFYTKEIKNIPRRINYILVFICLFSILVGVSPIIGFGHNQVQFPGTWCFFKIHSEEIVDKAFCIMYASTILIVILIMAVCNTLVIAFLKNESLEWAYANGRKTSISSVKSSRKKNDLYIIIFLVAIFVVFSACWTPFMVYIYVRQSGVHWNGQTELIIIRIVSLNQIIDPWVYILLRKENLMKFQKFCISTKDRHCKCNNLNFIKAPCLHTSLESHSISQSGL